jgi:hypothetical protein
MAEVKVEIRRVEGRGCEGRNRVEGTIRRNPNLVSILDHFEHLDPASCPRALEHIDPHLKRVLVA